MSHRVLIVDDSLTVRMDLHDAFTTDGFVTLLCATGEEARAAFAAGGFDAAVLDVLLPDADGLELLAELRRLPGRTGVVTVLLSTEDEVADRLAGLRTGADEYVGKPYDAGYVVARVRQLLSKPPTPADDRPAATLDRTEDRPSDRPTTTLDRTEGYPLRPGGGATARCCTQAAGSPGTRPPPYDHMVFRRSSKLVVRANGSSTVTGSRRSSSAASSSLARVMRERSVPSAESAPKSSVAAKTAVGRTTACRYAKSGRSACSRASECRAVPAVAAISTGLPARVSFSSTSMNDLNRPL